VVELVDAGDSKSPDLRVLRVRVSPWAFAVPQLTRCWRDAHAHRDRFDTLRFVARPARMTVAIAAIALCVLATSAAQAQTPAHEHAGMPRMDHATPTVSPKAKREIGSVARAMNALEAPGAARAAGFKPVFGWIPTMGEHWVDNSRMDKAQQRIVTAPNNLMFSRINGRDSLVGAAYAYFAAAGDTVRPALFDGTPPWHEHANLAPPGQTLVMLHVWFVPSPDGPFAGTNPNLPYWAAGLAGPDTSRMRDPAFNASVRRAALALADVTDTISIFPLLARDPETQGLLKPHRDSVRLIIPELLAAEKAKDAARWDRAAQEAAAHWDGIYHVYLSKAQTPGVKERIEKRVAMLLGGHGH
jgi:hypothetical protein